MLTRQFYCQDYEYLLGRKVSSLQFDAPKFNKVYVPNEIKLHFNPSSHKDNI